MSNSSSNPVNEMPTHRLVEMIDRFILLSGRGMALLSLPLLAIIVVQVILRYVFSSGLIILEELQWHLYAVLAMFAISFGVAEDIHIRMDLIYTSRSTKTKAWIDLIGMVVFALPLALVFCVSSFGLVEASYKVLEGSTSPGGLPYRWVIKSVLPISMGFYALAIFSRIIRVAIFLFNYRGRKHHGI